MNDLIYVTKPSLPPLNEFTKLLKKIWQSKILTNNGPFHQQFEKELARYLGVNQVSLFANGTLALIVALKALKIKGEVITTPFTFPATTHALWWNNIKPVFADVDPVYGNLDPNKVEAAITKKTTAILPVHVYGNPCEVEKLAKIAKKHHLKIIYDAAHAFGVKVDGQSILNFGDASILSFHATKVFNTIEGGAIISHNLQTKQRVDLLKNFGFKGEGVVVEPGMNAKMNEVQAACGLLQLRQVEGLIKKRQKIVDIYRKKLSKVKGVRLINNIKGVRHNYSHLPIFIQNDYALTKDQLYKKLKKYQIFSRKYFFPLVSQLPMYKNLPSSKPSNLKTAERLAKQVLCLPLYPELSFQNINKICKIIAEQ